MSQYANVPMGCPEAGSELLPGKRKLLRGYFFGHENTQKGTKEIQKGRPRKLVRTFRVLLCVLVATHYLPQAEQQKKGWRIHID
jgi:hypothetical protein